MFETKDALKYISLKNLAIQKFPYLEGAFEKLGEANRGFGLTFTELNFPGNRKMAEMTSLVADNISARESASVESGYSELRQNDHPGKKTTDLYTYGNGPCVIYIINQRFLVHTPNNMSYLNGLARMTGDSLEEIFLVQFREMITAGEKIKDLIALPGKEWTKEASDKLKRTIDASLPRAKTFVSNPGLHFVWLGFDPRRSQNDKVCIAVVDSLTNRLIVGRF